MFIIHSSRTKVNTQQRPKNCWNCSVEIIATENWNQAEPFDKTTIGQRDYMACLQKFVRWTRHFNKDNTFSGNLWSSNPCPILWAENKTAGKGLNHFKGSAWSQNSKSDNHLFMVNPTLSSGTRLKFFWNFL